MVAFLPTRGAYFPRTPPEKSYSDRIPFAAGLHLGFFMPSFLAFGREPCVDDPDSIAALRMSHDQQPAPSGEPNQEKPLLGFGMVWIGDRARERIAEGLRSLFKRDTVLVDVPARLFGVPLERVLHSPLVQRSQIARAAQRFAAQLRGLAAAEPRPTATTLRR